MENCKITELYNLDETIAKDLLSKYTYPWEVLAHINDFILELGATLPTDEYNKMQKLDTVLLFVVKQLLERELLLEIPQS